MEPTNQSQPLAEMMSRAAQELRELAEATARLHCLIDHVHWPSVAEKHAFLQSAQAIDCIEQRLAALSDFLSALAELTPSGWRVESHLASQRLKVAELAAKLSNEAAHGAHCQHPVGEPEFFDDQ
jgi:hypothetical protein